MQTDTTQFPPPSPAVDATPASTGRGVVRATLIIGIFHLVRLLIGFVTQPLIANRLGLRAQADVYAVSSDIVSSLWLVFEKILNPTVLPLFARSLKTEGEASAWKFAASVLCLTSLGVLLVAPLAWFGMPFIVDIYSQKAGAEQRELTVAIARLLLAGLYFLAISSLTYVLLNGYKRFAAAALGDAGWKLGILLAAAFAVGTRAGLNESLYILAYGFLIGSFLKLAPQLWALRDHLKSFRPQIDWRDPRLKAAALLAVPLLIGVVTSESRDIYRNWLADSPLIVTASGAVVEGSRAALKFSRLIASSLIQIFPYALSIGIFPFLADMATEKDKEGFTDTLVGALRVCIFVFGPITAILIAVRLPLLRAVWESGRFTAQDTLVLTAPFIAYALGLIGLACENVLNQSFYAMTRVWVPTIIGLVATVLFVAAATAGVHWGWGLAAIAGAESLSKLVKCLIMWRMLKPHLTEVPRRETWMFLGQVAVGSLLAALVAGVAISFLAPDEGAARFKIVTLLAVTVAGSLGMIVFGVFASLLRVREMEFVRRAPEMLNKRLGRKK